MTLDVKDIKTGPSDEVYDIASLYEDVTRMDEDQLDKYARLIFTGNRDLKFLPEQFWDSQYFSILGYGNYGHDNGRTVQQPGVFLGGLYKLVPKMIKGEFTKYVGDKIDVDEEYRGRLDNVIIGIITGLRENPMSIETKNRKMLAYFSVQTVERMLEEKWGLYTGFAHLKNVVKITDEEYLKISFLNHFYENDFSRDLVNDPKFSLARRLITNHNFEDVDFIYNSQF